MTDHAKAAAAAHAQTIEALYDLHCWTWDEATDLEGLNSKSLNILESLKPLSTFSDTLERIEDYAREMPLSVLVRSGWYAPGEPAPDAAEFELLLSTGGPACRIIGAVCNDSPVDPILQWQDWFTPLERVRLRHKPFSH